MKILFVKDNAICRTVVTKSLQELAGFDDRPPNFLTATAQTQEPLTTQRHQIQPPRAAIFNRRQHPAPPFSSAVNIRRIEPVRCSSPKQSKRVVGERFWRSCYFETRY